ncbi:hypothetical protein D3C79_947730 [compost metagenome]
MSFSDCCQIFISARYGVEGFTGWLEVLILLRTATAYVVILIVLVVVNRYGN